MWTRELSWNMAPHSTARPGVVFMGLEALIGRTVAPHVCHDLAEELVHHDHSWARWPGYAMQGRTARRRMAMRGTSRARHPRRPRVRTASAAGCARCSPTRFWAGLSAPVGLGKPKAITIASFSLIESYCKKPQRHEANRACDIEHSEAGAGRWCGRMEVRHRSCDVGDLARARCNKEDVS